MAVKYVKDFGFDSGFGYTGSAGKTPVRAYMRGGAVKSKGFDNSTRNPISKFPDIAPAMVEKTTAGMGGKASETKKLASYNKPHSAGKDGAKVPMYAKGGAVKKAHAKKEMPSFLKAKMMKKADGGMIASDPNYEERMERLRSRSSGPEMNPPEMDEQGRIIYGPGANLDSHRRLNPPEGRGEDRGGPGQIITPMTRKLSPLARARQMLANRRRSMMADRRDVALNRGEPTMRRPAPVRRAMPVAPKAAMLPPITPPKLPEYTGPKYKPGDIVYDALGQPGYVAEPVSPENRLKRGQPIPPGGYAKGGKVSKGEKKIGKVMGEFKQGKLHSGSKEGPVVKNPKQAVAIALSEARQAGAKIPKKKAMGGRACG